MDLLIKACPVSNKEFTISQGDLDFYDKISPTFTGQKFQIPTPTLHPEERQRRRLAFRNERNLYRRKCDASGKDIISIYKPIPLDKGGQGGFKVYDQKIRWSDARNPIEYGRDFDFSKTFTENFQSLLMTVPKKGLVSEYNENCDYTSICGYCKDCYLTSASERSEKCYYGNLIQDSNNIVDGSFIYNCSHIYNSINCHNCFNSTYLLNCKDCSDCTACYNLIGCSFCYQCYDLHNQKYCINNIQYSKEEYLQQLGKIEKKMDLSILSQFVNQSNHSIYEGFNNEHTSGKYINNSHNIHDGFDIEKGENISYSQIVVDGENLYDCTNVYIENEMSLEIMSALTSKFNIFSGFVYNCNNCLYSLNLNDSNNCFGCDGLRNKSYCIFNKQYTKEEYEIQVAKIISHMIETKERGEFFHPSLSPFGYNETVAQEYFPLDRVGTQIVASVDNTSSRTYEHTSLQAIHLENFGYHRSDYQSPQVTADKIIEGKELPTTIDEVSDDILKTAIKCEITGKLFRIIPQELTFYRKHYLPLPRRHPDQRHLDRLALRK